MKITIKTEDLLKNAEEYLAKVQMKNEEITKEREEKGGHSRKDAVEKLHELADILEGKGDISELEEDGWVSLYRGKLKVELDLVSISPPSIETFHIERDIAALKSCPRPTINVGPDDHLYKYLADPDKGRFR